MREIENNRMNFLMQRRRVFTYKIMLIVFACWFVLMLAIFGFLLVRENYARKNVVGAKKELALLDVSKEKELSVVAELGKENISTAGKEDLKTILYTRPRWSKVLRELVRNLPPQVWLESVGVKSEKEGPTKLYVRGKMKSPRALTNFIVQLESGGSFRKTDLLNTEQASSEEGNYNFEFTTIPIVK